MMRKNKDGFTLIELMIVIAIIAIIAAIAIPGLLASQRASNERSASASLKTIATAEADFRANDRDGNKIQDFYVADAAGLYSLVPIGATETVKLIEISVLSSDFESLLTGGPGVVAAVPGAPGPIVMVDALTFAVIAPKAGYWFKALINDELAMPYVIPGGTGGVVDVAGNPNTFEWYNHGKFGFCAFPDSFSSGRNAFFMNENNTVFKRSVVGPVKLTATLPRTATPLILGTGLLGGNPAEDWATDTELKLEYSKID